MTVQNDSMGHKKATIRMEHRLLTNISGDGGGLSSLVAVDGPQCIGMAHFVCRPLSMDCINASCQKGAEHMRTFRLEDSVSLKTV